MSKKGFTLIELMVVVAIIGILATIAVPSYKHWIEKARINETKNNLARIRAAVTLYRSVEGIYPAMLQDLVTANGYQDGNVTVKYLDQIPAPYIPDHDTCADSCETGVCAADGFPVCNYVWADLDEAGFIDGNGAPLCADDPCGKCNCWIYITDRAEVKAPCLCNNVYNERCPFATW
ncbi:MAG: prepilin-type N-terminal cleavage/methylation domain-containing protein [bacterium]